MPFESYKWQELVASDKLWQCLPVPEINHVSHSMLTAFMFAMSAGYMDHPCVLKMADNMEGLSTTLLMEF